MAEPKKMQREEKLRTYFKTVFFIAENSTEQTLIINKYHRWSDLQVIKEVIVERGGGIAQR